MKYERISIESEKSLNKTGNIFQKFKKSYQRRMFNDPYATQTVDAIQEKGNEAISVDVVVDGATLNFGKYFWEFLPRANCRKIIRKNFNWD